MVSSDVHPTEVQAAEKLVISIPFGLIGLRQLTRFELEPVEGIWPFQRFRALDGDGVELIVVEPQTVLESYPVNLSDQDAEELGLSEGNTALVLNVVTVHSYDPQFVTVNLIGPIVVNRKTMMGKQVILANSSRYSVYHVLADMRERTEACGPGE